MCPSTEGPTRWNPQPLGFSDAQLEAEYLLHRSSKKTTVIGEVLCGVLMVALGVRNTQSASSTHYPQTTTTVALHTLACWFPLPCYLWCRVRFPSTWAHLRDTAFAAYIGMIWTVAEAYLVPMFAAMPGSCSRRYYGHILLPAALRALMPLWMGFLQLQHWCLMLFQFGLLYADWLQRDWQRGLLWQCSAVVKGMECGAAGVADTFRGLRSAMCHFLPSSSGCLVELTPLQQGVANRVFLWLVSQLLSIPLAWRLERYEREMFLASKARGGAPVPEHPFWIDDTAAVLAGWAGRVGGSVLNFVLQLDMGPEELETIWWGVLLFAAQVVVVVGAAAAWGWLCLAAQQF